MLFIIIGISICFIDNIFRAIMLHLKAKHRIIMNRILYGISVKTLSI